MGAELLVPGGVAVALVSGAATYLVARRKSSGTINTSESKELWDAYNAHQERVDANLARVTEEMEKLRNLTRTLGEEVLVERRGRVDCENRIATLETRDAGSAIIELAKKEAATIRFDAVKAAELLHAAANEAAVTVKKDAAVAKKTIDEAKP